MNTIEQIIRQIRNSEKDAECTWTYREVCAQLLQILKEIIASDNPVQDTEAAHVRLANCLRLAQVVGERDPSLIGVVSSVGRLIDRIDTCGNLAEDAVLDAIEVLILEIGFTVSRRG
jgi:hypothetical protein